MCCRSGFLLAFLLSYQSAHKHTGKHRTPRVGFVLKQSGNEKETASEHVYIFSPFSPLLRFSAAWENQNIPRGEENARAKIGNAHTHTQTHAHRWHVQLLSLAQDAYSSLDAPPTLVFFSSVVYFYPRITRLKKYAGTVLSNRSFHSAGRKWN